MKKKLAVFISLSVLLGITVFSSCSADSKVTIDVYNWGEYIDESVLKDFEAETGIRVNYTTFNTNEELYSKLKNSGAMYDVIIPSDYMIGRMIEEDMIQKLDINNIPNYKSILDEFKNMEFDAKNEYSIPYMWGTVGIIYNKTMVTDPVDSWSILFNEKYKGKILMFDNSRDAMGIALKMLGYSLNTQNKNELMEAGELLKQQKPLVQAYVMDQIFDKMEGGEAALAPYYAGDGVTMMSENPDLDFVIPKEGSNKFIDCMCIPKGSAHKAEAEAFINFMCKDDIVIKNSKITGYSIPTKAVSLLPDEVKNNKNIYPPEDVLKKCDFFINLPLETRNIYDNIWTSLKV